MNSNRRELNERVRRVESRNLTMVADDFPIYWDRAAGSEVWDTDGRRYIDFSSAFGVASIGHSHPDLVVAIAEQSERLIHGMGDVFPSLPRIELLEKLQEWVGGGVKSILSLSGTEAVESCLKTAAVFTGRPGVIAFEGAYHGLGYGSLSVTHRSDFREPFYDQLGIPVWHLPFPTESNSGEVESEIERILAAGGTGAVIIEPIQGRGGIRVPPAGFLSALSETVHSHDAVLIFDEVMTGFCRTGARFAFQSEDVFPDLIALGKGLGGGMPISAAVGRPGIMDAWPESTGEAIHTSTFLGHPLACRAALAVLSIMESEELDVRSARLGEEIKRRMERFSPRGRGLMIGYEMPSGNAARAAAQAALEDGLIALLDGADQEVLVLLPPLTISEALLDEGLSILEPILEQHHR